MNIEALIKDSEYDTIMSLDIDELIAMKKNDKYLKRHPYSVWQSKDGKYWYTTFPDDTKPRGVRQVRRNSKKEIQQEIINFWMDTVDGKTVQEVYEEWADNRLEMKRIVKATYINVNSVFNTHFSGIKDRQMNSIKPIDWCDFLEEELISHNMTKVMFGTLKSLVTGIVKWAYKRSYIEYSATAITDLLDIPEKAYRDTRKTDDEEVYSETETPIIVNYLIEHQDLKNLGLLLMFVSGVRIGELIALKHKDFVNGNTIQVRRTISVSIKENGKVGRVVKDTPKTFAGIRDIIVPDAFAWLVEYFANGEPDDYIFYSNRGNLMKYDSINLRLQSICKELGIPFRTTHKIRKTYGSILLDNGVDTRFVMQQMGHNDISCTENYYHKDRKNEAKKEQIINGLASAYKKQA